MNINDKQTSYEIWFGHKPDPSNLKVFSCKSHVLIHKGLKHKLDTHSIKCIFLSYNDESRAYHIMEIKNKTIVISRHVFFYEAFTKK
jgi:hypothetical protein